MKQLNGIHHVTAITSSAEKIYQFFTYILGLRLVKKTVNQDDIQTYHLFFADDIGSAGTDMTFFDFPGVQKAIKGSDEIAKTSFRVPNDLAIDYYKKRFETYQVKHDEIKYLFGIKTLAFEDFDGQEYVLFSDEHDQGVKPGIPWQKGPIPLRFAIRGLGPIFFRVRDEQRMDRVLTHVMGFEKIDQQDHLILYQTGLKGNGSSVILDVQHDLPQARQGYGGVHHVAFRIDDKKAINDWIQTLNALRAPHSGYVDRFYFESLYTRLYPGILFEFATEGPGFIDDEEAYEVLGETLALPPKFRHQRQQIEKLVRYIDTVRSNKVFEKEELGI
ncbi:MAG: ring-cleaving dioxygenase [Bacillota bacterium]|nr:MAG: ring-cleaving dioxygenase [Bacillota bacterium]